MEGLSQTEFYQTVYDSLYKIGYHSRPEYSHAYGVIEYMIAELDFVTVIDLGASIGAAVNHLNMRGKEALGLETSLVAVNRASDLGRPVMWGEATRIPFADNSIDVVMSTDVMEHLKPEDVEQCISECHRVAKSFICMKISSEDEQAGWGKKVGVENLHLTVQPISWWIEQFLKPGGEVIYHEGDTFCLKLGE
jgi:2-polyprenyl-3-methyl-5-hydroxy-6-metoxy-1,4-benzoquinol methylase